MRYKDEIDNMTWSFSRVTTYEQCPYEWYLRYILQDDDEYPQEPNYYAQVGSFVHKILEKVYNKKLKADDAIEYYLEHFDENVTAYAPSNVKDKTFESCAEYLSDTDLINQFKRFKIVGVEQRVEFEIDGRKFTGFIDLLLQDKKTGELTIVDHKSSAYPFNKNGTVKASAKSFEKYKKQLYLYAHWVKEKYGEFPKTLAWNHFKDGGKIARIEFNKNEYDEAIKWFMDEIKAVNSDDSFEPQMDYFYCNNLCAYRNVCEYREEDED